MYFVIAEVLTDPNINLTERDKRNQKVRPLKVRPPSGHDGTLGIKYTCTCTLSFNEQMFEIFHHCAPKNVNAVEIAVLQCEGAFEIPVEITVS